MAHSLLSAPLNLGLLDPLEVVARAEQRVPRLGAAAHPCRSTASRASSGRSSAGGTTSGTCTGTSAADYRQPQRTGRPPAVPGWFADLDADAVDAACLSDVLAGSATGGWAHHIPRLMVLGNYALQRGCDPAGVTDWFHRGFVDGYDWVMVANVVGMSPVRRRRPDRHQAVRLRRRLHRPDERLLRRLPVRPDRSGSGDDACPYTAGYWAFLDRTRDRLPAITAWRSRCRASTGSRPRRGGRAGAGSAERRRRSQATTPPAGGDAHSRPVTDSVTPSASR